MNRFPKGVRVPVGEGAAGAAPSPTRNGQLKTMPRACRIFASPVTPRRRLPALPRADEANRPTGSRTTDAEAEVIARLPLLAKHPGGLGLRPPGDGSLTWIAD